MNNLKIGIIGTGVMGKGIALAFAEKAGFDVFLSGRTLVGAEKAFSAIKKILHDRVAKERITQTEAKAIADRIHTGTWNHSYQCDVIIECIPENFNLKVGVLKELILKSPKAIIATNTSSLSLQKLQDATGYPLVGMHFFNPAYIMKLVEVVYTEKNEERDINSIKKLSLKIDKTPILVKDNPGFIVNRILIIMINEAITQYEARVASAEDIDTAMKLGCNHPMGPLELADYIGLDIVLAIMNNIWKQTGEDKYEPAKLLVDMVSDNKLGRKTGEGFYQY